MFCSFKIKFKFWFWCKDEVDENIAHIFLAELYFMLLAQTIDGRTLSDFGQTDPVNQSVLF
ncbi:hypothetical protein BW900_30535 [Bacillus mycoides]|uniref:Uncharacterized protein n=1 Tax=Bacillus mycoides TaxID=1405 RepID=A0A1S9SYP6_BACMY|nr:hypothetical protein BW900_30535 [Bacillus mycoides]RAN68264.1 hypothetical protein B5P40_20755 [Bacillus sp. SRB_8]